jgi:hypothetical protein
VKPLLRRRAVTVLDHNTPNESTYTFYIDCEKARVKGFHREIHFLLKRKAWIALGNNVLEGKFFRDEVAPLT